MRYKKLLIIPALAGTFALGACTAEVEEEGNLPEVEVVEEGSLPEVDVNPAEVEVGADTQTVVTPEVEVNQE
jgi:hypothetical protein